MNVIPQNQLQLCTGGNNNVICEDGYLAATIDVPSSEKEQNLDIAITLDQHGVLDYFINVI